MTYTASLDDPLATWAMREPLIEKDQGWYPQVVGEATIHRTDTLAGERARYFDRGV